MLSRKISVLIVDDEKYIREGLQALLKWETMGFSVCDEAGTGEEALEKIFLYQPDLVLMDIKMPGMSGIDVIKTVREKDYAGEIIVLSGYSDFQYAQSAMHYGVEEYIVKPVEEKILLDAVLRVKEKISRVCTGSKFCRRGRRQGKEQPDFSRRLHLQDTGLPQNTAWKRNFGSAACSQQAIWQVGLHSVYLLGKKCEIYRRV